MYRIDVSWYYCRSEKGLRLSHTTRQIRICGTPELAANNFSARGLTCMTLPGNQNERRKFPRLPTTCEAEILADLSILDSEAEGPTEPLVFMGQTKDMSKGGVSLVLPSLLIDERFCTSDNLIELSLFLPEGPVSMIVTAVRCAPLDQTDGGRGYLLGARIKQVLERRDDFEEYLESLTAN